MTKAANLQVTAANETAGSTVGKPGRVTKTTSRACASWDALAVGMSTAVVTAHRMRPCRTRAGRGDPRDQKRERRSYKQNIPHHKLPF
jgi:hypothetical protein